MTNEHFDPSALSLVVKYAEPEVFFIGAEMAQENEPFIEKIGRKNGRSVNQGNGRCWHIYKTKKSIVVEHHGFA